MKRATQGAVMVHVDASPERVYALVSDVTRMGEWSPETHRCRWGRITNWFNGILLGVADRDDDLIAGMRTTLAGIKAAAEAQADAAASAPGGAHIANLSER